MFSGLDRETIKLLARLARGEKPGTVPKRRLKAGTVLVREYQGQQHTVTIVSDGFAWRETAYASLSSIARAITGTAWNGPRFFGLRSAGEQDERSNGAEGRSGLKGGIRRDPISGSRAAQRRPSPARGT